MKPQYKALIKRFISEVFMIINSNRTSKFYLELMAIANNLTKIRAFILFFDLIMSIEKS